MKKKASGLEIAASAARGANRILNTVIAMILIIAFLYSGYGLWDTWQIYNGAGLDSEMLKYKPVEPEGDAPNPTLSDLQKLNPDVCAWLTVDDTSIDYPVVQGKSNLEYINKDVYGEFSLSGSVFLDYRNSADFSDYYSLLYAHHIEGNVMFGELPEFLNKKFFQEHTSGMLFMPDHTYRIEWFSCISTDAYDSKVFKPMKVDSESDKEELLEYIKEESAQYREIEMTASDRIIGLSTCSDASTNGRVLLFGRLRINE